MTSGYALLACALGLVGLSSCRREERRAVLRRHRLRHDHRQCGQRQRCDASGHLVLNE